ncbi:GNAT family N-acetyltransferase [Desulfosporosinus sp. BG]|uniref:GNAT family N-acetyltransferase n=1 Tax=Desulfosporosinus sp. BG TaxID=1633135 RepID=UPI00083B4EF8|nr:GNAT family N-acetyltransferase [Desulfosporosinus sp. BG]ODA42913.1 Proteins containing SET domain [Desulfosporosinus sp. BG]
MEIKLKILTIDSLSQLQILMEKSNDYLTFEDEAPVKPSAAQDLFKARPDGIEDQDKVVLGVYNVQEQMVGVFDLIKGYPNPKTLTLGLMLLEPNSRGKGIGNKAYNVLEEWVVNQQFYKIRLGVLFGNEKGLGFWIRMGFIETGEVKQRLTKKVLVLEKRISTL